MTGLEKIIGKIEENSRVVCEEIVSTADEKAKAIISKAQSEAEKNAEEIISKAKAQAERRIAASKASAETITRTKYLEVRNDVINDIISAAYEEINSFEAEEYFDFLFQLLLKNFESGECIMYLSKKDISRLPKNFEDRINGEVYEKGAVQISKKPHEIENGFVLDYGDFEIDCTLRAVFDEKMDELRDILSKHLFDSI